MKRILLAILIGCLTAPSAAFAADPPPVPPPSDDAAVWYLTALGRIDGVLDSFDDPDTAEAAATQSSEEAFDLDEAGPVIDQIDDGLGWARRGATLDRCTWPTTLEEDGPYALLPHLSEMRKLGRIFVTSAMVQRERGDLGASTDEYITVMRLARHAAADHTMIGVLVQNSIDGLAVNGLAGQLDRYDRAGLESLQAELASVPPYVPMSAAIPTERMLSDWIDRIYKENGLADTLKKLNELTNMTVISVGAAGPDLQGMDAAADPPWCEAEKFTATAEQFEQWLAEMDEAYGRMQELFELPPTEFKDRYAAFDAQLEASANPLIRSLMPAVGRARSNEFTTQSRRAMLDAMIAYRLGGEDAFLAVVDPYDGKPFGREVNDEGVVLTARVISHSGKPWSLTFPGACAEPLE